MIEKIRIDENRLMKMILMTFFNYRGYERSEILIREMRKTTQKMMIICLIILIKTG